MKFGEKLKKKRKEAQLTQAELACKIGVTFRTIINYENNNIYPRNREIYQKLADVFDVDVKRFVPQRHEDKVPQMGWNTIENTESLLFKGFDKPEFVYFIHSFYVPVCDWTIAQTDYIHPYSSALHRDNFYATQFHPEKSGAVGEKILKNFFEI